VERAEADAEVQTGFSLIFTEKNVDSTKTPWKVCNPPVNPHEGNHGGGSTTGGDKDTDKDKETHQGGNHHEGSGKVDIEDRETGGEGFIS
jgi:hypothetical protein